MRLWVAYVDERGEIDGILECVCVRVCVCVLGNDVVVGNLT